MSDSEHESEEGMVVEDENDEAGESSGIVSKREPRQVYLPGHQMMKESKDIRDEKKLFECSRDDQARGRGISSVCSSKPLHMNTFLKSCMNTHCINLPISPVRSP